MVGSSSKLSQNDLDTITRDWPARSKEVAQDIMSKYGLPSEGTPHMLIWLDNGPWKKTIVYGHEVEHNFPLPHEDVVEQVIDYRVPVDKLCDLGRFSGSIYVYRTEGLLSSACDGEALNILNLNLANEIITGKRTVKDARQEVAKEAIALKLGERPLLTQKLQFSVQGATADPDQPAETMPRAAQGGISPVTTSRGES